MRYRRHLVPGCTVFLTLVTDARRPLLCEPAVRAAFRDAAKHVAARHPFKTVAFVILPDHCHLIWQMPEDSGDFPLRVRLIKHLMARQQNLPHPVWQKRYWEHVIRDERDLQRHIDYVHFNPVKHGHAGSAASWFDSSFATYVERGRYSVDWMDNPDDDGGVEGSEFDS